MNFVIDKIKLGRQATLFDSYLYVLKAFASVLTAYVLFHTNSIVGKDMISVLFGMMLTLEPVNIAGIKSGWDQMKASILGGVITAVLVYLFGVNFITIPLGVALTMYVSLKMNWRFVSPVAIFTAIYMTQYIQLDASGDPSMLLTFRLRILALGAGILIAVFYNFVFSKFFYKSMLRKRVVYIVESLGTHLETYLKEEKTGDLKALKTNITGLFSDIDLVLGQLSALEKAKSLEKAIPYDKYGTALSELRDFTHYFLDVIMYRMKHETGVADLEVLKKFKELLAEIQKISEHKNSDPSSLKVKFEENQSLNLKDDSYLSSMYQSVLGAAKCFL